MNGINLVPGTVALANESGQNSAALKNITIDTGSVKFNTAIVYDTDVNRTAYSRVKHYINNGKAYTPDCTFMCGRVIFLSANSLIHRFDDGECIF